MTLKDVKNLAAEFAGSWDSFIELVLGNITADEAREACSHPWSLTAHSEDTRVGTGHLDTSKVRASIVEDRSRFAKRNCSKVERS